MELSRFNSLGLEMDSLGIVEENEKETDKGGEKKMCDCVCLKTDWVEERRI